MANGKATLGRAFGVALCKHFGLPPGKVADTIKVNVTPCEIFSVSLNLALTADDLAGIAEHMAKDEPEQKTCQ